MVSDPTPSDSDAISQQVIKKQLQSLSRRLDKAKHCKKTSDQNKIKNKTVKKKVKRTETLVTLASDAKKFPPSSRPRHAEARCFDTA